MRRTVLVTDPHHEFFGRVCVLSETVEGKYVRPLYGTVVLSIQLEQYEEFVA